MHRASSTPKGAAAPAGSPANREIEALAAHARDGHFIKRFEALAAYGYKPDPADTVQDNILSHFLRDLAPVTRNPARPATPSTVPTAAGGKGRSGRRPVTPDLILNCQSYAAALKHLARATLAEEAELEAKLPDALDWQAEKREAAARAKAAYAWKLRIPRRIAEARRLWGQSPTPAQLRRLVGLDLLHRDAVRDHAAAAAHVAALRLLDRRALGFPMPRDRKLNKSRHRLAKGRRRSRRWWETIPAAKAASESRKRSKAPRWRDLTPAALVYAHTAAGYTFGRTIAYTLNLTADVEAKARTKPDPAAWLRDLIARRIEQAVGRPAEVLVCLELNGLGALHAHGIVAGLNVGEDAAVKSALTVAGGDGYRGRQVVLAASPDSGWASYCAKDFLKPFKWKHRYAATRGLAAAAREVFAGMRTFVQECQGREGVEDKSTFTSPGLVPSKNDACNDLDTSLTMSRHIGGEAVCISARLPKKSSPTFGRAWRSRDGPTPDG